MVERTRLLNSTLVLRCQYGDESLAMLRWIADYQEQNPHRLKKVIAAYLATGWEGEGWPAHVEQGEAYARSLGFEAIRLSAEWGFEQLITHRGGFPSQKFQWCAGLLKGVPLLKWLDEQDPENHWFVGIAKRQALMRSPLTEWLAECPYHGDRAVWHPMAEVSHEGRAALLARTAFPPQYPRSQECQPCVLSNAAELKVLAPSDIQKTAQLEEKVHNGIFPKGQHGPAERLPEKVQWLKINAPEESRQSFDSFYRGCGDPFGCGL